MKQLILIGFSVIAFATQAQTPEESLLTVYSQEELSTFKSNNEGTFEMLVYALENACYITDIPQGKAANLESILITPSKNISFVSLGKRIEKQNQYYSIEGTDKMLVIKSSWVLNNEMRNK